MAENWRDYIDIKIPDRLYKKQDHPDYPKTGVLVDNGSNPLYTETAAALDVLWSTPEGRADILKAYELMGNKKIEVSTGYQSTADPATGISLDFGQINTLMFIRKDAEAAEIGDIKGINAAREIAEIQEQLKKPQIKGDEEVVKKLEAKIAELDALVNSRYTNASTLDVLTHEIKHLADPNLYQFKSIEGSKFSLFLEECLKTQNEVSTLVRENLSPEDFRKIKTGHLSHEEASKIVNTIYAKAPAGSALEKAFNEKLQAIEKLSPQFADPNAPIVTEKETKRALTKIVNYLANANDTVGESFRQNIDPETLKKIKAGTISTDEMMSMLNNETTFNAVALLGTETDRKKARDFIDDIRATTPTVPNILMPQFQKSLEQPIVDATNAHMNNSVNPNLPPDKQIQDRGNYKYGIDDPTPENNPHKKSEADLVALALKLKEQGKIDGYDDTSRLAQTAPPVGSPPPISAPAAGISQQQR